MERVSERNRVHGIVLYEPLVSSLLDRARAGCHDLVVAPDGWRELLIVLALRAKTNIPLLLVSKRGKKRLLKTTLAAASATAQSPAGVDRVGA
jgi:hypothetical protein